MRFPPSIVPAWVVMWGTSISIYMLLKEISWLGRKPGDVARWKKVAYLLGWAGMDVDRFLNTSCSPVSRPRGPEWGFALIKMGFGLFVVVIVVPNLSDFDPYIIGWVGMIGIVFSLHFGLFHILSLLWRAFGLQADPLMKWPIASQNLAEFWGLRWNRAFRDLTHRFLFRPLVPYWGASGSLMAGFVMSGFIHDVVISLPAGGGLGGPTVFFVLQGLGLTFERSRLGRSLGLGRGWRGRLYCVIFLLLPLPLLFHRPFVCNVIVSFLRAIGSSS